MWSGPLSVAQRLNLRLHGIFIALVLLVAVLGCFGPMLDNVDVGWHVAQGRWMVHHLAFYRADVLNYPTAGQPVVDEYPFFQLALYLSTLVGWWGPCVLAALGYVALLAILLLTGRAFDLGPSATFALILGVMLIYLNIAFLLRPHLVTYLGVAAFGSFLLRHREAASWTRFWPLALVQIIWTNCHSGFVLGPLMVAVFGLEMIVRRWVRSLVFPWTAVRIWSAATLLVFLGCFANPWGVLRFGAPFYQEHLGVIRAYVGEMQPLNGGAAAHFNFITLLSALLIIYVIVLRRGAFSWSLVAFACAFYLEALQVRKAWPVFGLFLPLIVLSSAAFARTTITRRKSIAWASVAGHMVVLVGLVVCVMNLFDPADDASLAVKWREWSAGRTELPVAAASWLKENHVEGRLLHRCEDGGWLQEQELGPTFADTGFGKYDEAFIRLTGLMAERPALLGGLIAHFQPNFIVCDGFAFAWPAYLRQAGCRLVFYSPNSSVWVAPAVRPDLATVGLPQVEAAFLADLNQHGLPRDLLLYGRDLVALNSMGDSAFAIGRLQALPAAMHREGWYWEAARLMCFDPPGVPPDLQKELRAEADTRGDVATEFRAYDDAADGHAASARGLLGKIPQGQLTDREAMLLLSLELEAHAPEALPLAQHEKLFDLSDGEHWIALARLEEQTGDTARADRAWQRAVYFAPDLLPLGEFDRQHPDVRVGSFLTSFGWAPFYLDRGAPEQSGL